MMVLYLYLGSSCEVKVQTLFKIKFHLLNTDSLLTCLEEAELLQQQEVLQMSESLGAAPLLQR